MPAIALENLVFTYPPPMEGAGAQASAPVLRGVKLTVEHGEFLSIMGATGAGKSTLLMAMNGLVPRATGGVFGGRALVLGHDTRETSVAALASRVGMVFQDPESQLFSATVEDELAFGPENLAVDRIEIVERIGWALNMVGMAPYRGRSPNHLSGGQKQRVAIAAALTLLPEVLILDEPTASLDPLGKQEVVATIEALARRHTMTIVMASHDAEQVAEFSDRVAVLHEGVIARLDAPLALFEDADLLAAAGLAGPQVAQVSSCLRQGRPTIPRFCRFDAAEQALRQTLVDGMLRP